MNKVISVEVHHTGIRAIDARVNGNRITVNQVAAATHPTIGELCEQENGQQAFRTFLDEEGFSNAPVLLSIPSSSGYLQHLHLPFTGEQKVRDTAPFELEEHMQSVSIDQTQVDLQLLETSEEGTHLLAGAIEKETLGNLIRSVSHGGWNVISIRFSLLSCYQYLIGAGRASEHADFWIVSSDGTCVSLMLVQNRRPVGTRVFHVRPSSDPDDGEDRNRDHLDTEDEEKGTAKHGSSAAEHPVELDWLPKLKQEIQHMLLASGVDHAMDRMYFLGDPPGEMSQDQLSDRLDDLFILDDSRSSDDVPEDRSSNPDQTMDETDKNQASGQEQTASTLDIRWNVSEPISRYAACVGAAGTMASSTSQDIEFRKGEFARQSLWQSVRPYLTVFLFALLIGSLTFLFFLRGKISQREDVLNKYKNEQETIYNELYPERSLPTMSTVPDALQRRLTKQQENNPGDYPLKTSSLQYWISLYSGIEGRGDIKITKLIIRMGQQGAGGKLIVEGNSESRELAVDLKNQIMSLQRFDRPEHARYPIRDERVQFSMAFPLSRQQENGS